MTPTNKIYVIYTADEKVTVHHFLKRLKSKIEIRDVEIWYDDSIKSDQLWRPSEKSRIYNTDIFILFVSNAFMYSEFIKQLEFKIIIDRYKAGTSKVIPLILENCPWDIDFESDEYTFNLNELHVLPALGKPVRSWESKDKALEESATYLKQILEALREDKKASVSMFGEEKVKRAPENNQSSSLSDFEDVEAKNKAFDELKRKVESAKNKAVQQQKFEAEYLEPNIADEIEFKEQKEIDAENVGREQGKLYEDELDNQPNSNLHSRKSLLVGIGLLAIVILLGTFYYKSTRNSNPFSEQQENDIVITNKFNEEDKTAEQAQTKTIGSGATLKKSDIGSRHKNGIIFKTNFNGKNVLVAHVKDAGPMTWNEAMKIHEQLGEGWRLPTLEELKEMYRTIGQGADNIGEFADGLYWSSTPYDSNQARLVRFEDGNTTFHYNSIGTFRKFKVRAIREFSR